MKKILFVFLLLFSSNANALNSRNLTIFAEAQIAIPLTKIARQYAKAANVVTSLNFTSSYNLSSTIDSGEPIDIFISAQSNLIENLHQKGVVDIYNVGYIAQDQLVVVAQKNNDNILPQLTEKNLSFDEVLSILDQGRANIVIDDKNNSSGFFSEELIKKSQLYNLKIFKRIAEDKTSILSTIKGGKTNYSILLNSQVYNKKDFIILAKSDKKISYQALVIAGDNMEVAREFLRFLKSDLAKDYLKSYGFIVN